MTEVLGRTHQLQAGADSRSSLQHVEELLIPNSNGDMVPLSALGTLQYEVGPRQITRFNKMVAAEINAQSAPGVSSGDLYAANGIGQASLEAYLLNAQKAEAIEQLLYGPDGQQPVTDDEYTAYINDSCYYIESIELPLVDYTTYAMADDDQRAEIEALAGDCAEELNQTATGETAGSTAVVR